MLNKLREEAFYLLNVVFIIFLQLLGEAFFCAEGKSPQKEVNILDLEGIKFHVAQVSENCEEKLNVAGVRRKSVLRREEIEKRTDVRWRARVVALLHLAP